jgi:hypothetical protein
VAGNWRAPGIARGAVLLLSDYLPHEVGG